jgi:hypothetical protein
MNDEYEGLGGSYIITDGVRKLVGRTANPGDESPGESPTLTETIPEQPATAGIFSPVAPADSTTTTE